MRKGCFIFCFIVLVFLLIGGYIINDFRKASCGNKKYFEKLSPNKKKKAVVFEYDCGATTDFSTQISILNSDQVLEPDESGNLFAADSNHGQAEMAGEIIDVKVSWIDDENLIIDYPMKSKYLKTKIQSVVLMCNTKLINNYENSKKTFNNLPDTCCIGISFCVVGKF